MLPRVGFTFSRKRLPFYFCCDVAESLAQHFSTFFIPGWCWQHLASWWIPWVSLWWLFPVPFGELMDLALLNIEDVVSVNKKTWVWWLELASTSGSLCRATTMLDWMYTVLRFVAVSVSETKKGAVWFASVWMQRLRFFMDVGTLARSKHIFRVWGFHYIGARLEKTISILDTPWLQFGSELMETSGQKSGFGTCIRCTKPTISDGQTSDTAVSVPLFSQNATSNINKKWCWWTFTLQVLWWSHMVLLWFVLETQSTYLISGHHSNFSYFVSNLQL